MLNVLHLIKYPGRGGSEKYILSLAEKMHNNKFRLYLAYSDDGPLADEMRHMGVECFKLTMESPWDIRAAKKLKDLCAGLSVDIVHTHFLRENFVSVFSKMFGNKARLVNTVHMLEGKKGLLRLANGIFSSRADGIIAVSGAVKELLINEGLPAEKISLIYNGVDYERFAGLQDTSSFRHDFGIGGDDFLVVSAARFSEEKGHDFLLRSISIFKQLYEKAGRHKRRVRFLLSGEGELLDECKKLCRQLELDDDVIFSGYITDIRYMLKAADLFVSHSYSESMGISVLEALSAGLPVVASNSGGPAEIVNKDTGCGILVEKGDTEGFAAAILRMLQDGDFYQACKANAVDVVKSRFSLDNMAEETYRLYSSLK